MHGCYTCAEQKTDMEEECPRNDRKKKQPVRIKYKCQRQPMKLNEDGCDMLMLSLFSDEISGTLLNSLKTIDLIKCDTGQAVDFSIWY